MSEPPSPAGKSTGQTVETQAWVARRDAAERAIKAQDSRAAEERTLAESERERTPNGNPGGLIAGIIVLLCVLLAALWLFLDRITCDPVWSDKGLGSYCKRPPQ